MNAKSQSVDCSRAAQWVDRVDDVPRSWFEALTENPRRLPMEKLPFNKEEREHLNDCDACRAAALDALEQRAQRRWMVLCPEASELSAWLRGGTNAALEAHLRECALCNEQAKRIAWLSHGAGLLSREYVEAKLRIIKPTPEKTEEAWDVFVAWLVEHFWFTREEQRAIGQAVTGWRLVVGGRRAAPPTKADLKERLTGDDSATLNRSEADVRWLLAQREGDAVVVQAGTSAAEKRERFRLVFRRGKDVIHSVTTREGCLRLTREDLIRVADADGFEVEDLKE